MLTFCPIFKCTAVRVNGNGLFLYEKEKEAESCITGQVLPLIIKNLLEAFAAKKLSFFIFIRTFLLKTDYNSLFSTCMYISQYYLDILTFFSILHNNKS